MKCAKILVLFATVMLIALVHASINLTATVSNASPAVEDIQICDGTCAASKSLDPATGFTVKVTVTDPNGEEDIDASAFELEFYRTSDSDADGADWDHVVLTGVSHGSGDGCVEGGSTYCLQVSASDWSTKFVDGAADVWVKAYDQYAEPASATDEAAGAIIVNKSVGISQDSTAASFGGAPGSTNNPIQTDQGNPYTVTTHNGNTNIDVDVTASALTSGENSIAVSNLHWDLDGTPPGTDFTGGIDSVKTAWGRGTDPNSATFDLYTWLDIPSGQPAGNYTGTFTFSSSAS